MKGIEEESDFDLNVALLEADQAPPQRKASNDIDNNNENKNGHETNDPTTTTNENNNNNKKKEKSSGRHGARNNAKAKLFLRWLQDTFPQAFVSTTTAPILDVAGGGTGELATRLAWCCQQRVVVVDPRCPVDLQECLQKIILPQLPKKWQQRAYQKRNQDPTAWATFLNEMVEQQNAYFLEETTLPSSLSGCGDDRLNPTLVQAIEQCSLLVGMHADSATEAIVEAALYYRKPFVVVPCCVFPNMFPNRRILRIPVSEEEEPSNMNPAPPPQQVEVPVRTYEQFCQYLLQKDARFQSSVLPFPGRNMAIWWDGTD